jgi:hypothetical protein
LKKRPQKRGLHEVKPFGVLSVVPFQVDPR